MAPHLPISSLEIGVINDLPRASNFLGGVLEVRNSGAEPCVKANKTFHKRVGQKMHSHAKEANVESARQASSKLSGETQEAAGNPLTMASRRLEPGELVP